MSDLRLGINVVASADAAQVERLTARIRDLQAAFQQLARSSNFDIGGAGVRGLIDQIERAQAQLRQLQEAMSRPPAAFESLPSNAWPVQYGRIVAEARKQTEELARAQAQFASQVAPQVNIANFRRETQEAARAEEALALAQSKFASQVAPQVNVAAHRREDAQRVREATAALERYDAELAREETQRNRFASQVAPQTQIRFVRGTEGLQAIPRDLSLITNEADKTALATRRLITGFDELARGQRGQLISTIGASLKDMGISAGGAALAFGAFLAVAAVDRLIKGAEAMGRWAEQTKAAAAATGTSVEAYSRLQGALVLTGAKAESADSSLRIFARNISEAIGDPASHAAQAFTAVGISIDFLKEHSNDTLAVFNAFADQFKALSTNSANATNLAAASSELLGRSVENMGRLLAGGSQKIKELGDQAEKAGIVLNDETATSIEKTGEQARALAATISGSAIKAFVAWEPEIRGVIALLTNLITTLGNATNEIGRMVASLNSFAEAHRTAIAASARGGVPIPSTAASQDYQVELGGGAVGARGGSGRRYMTVSPGFARVADRPENTAMPGVATVPAIGSQTTAYEQLQARVHEAQLKATVAGGSSQQMHQRALQSEIATLQQGLSAEGINAKQKLEIQAQVAEKSAELNEMRASAGASAARKDYEAFAANERNKLAMARGSVQEQEQILSEWGERAAKEGAKAIAEVQAARIRVQQEQTSAAMQGIHEAASNAELQIRQFEEEMQLRVKTRDPGTHVTQAQAYGFDIQEISSQYDTLRQQATSLLSLPNLTAQQQQAIQQLQTHLQLAEDVAVTEYQEKMTSAASAIGKALEKELGSAFDKVGSSLERYVTEALTRSTTGGKAGRQLLQGLVGSTVGGVSDIGSQLLSKLIGGAPGQGLGQTLATKLFSFIPGMGNLGQTGQTVATTANTAALGLNTAALTALTAAQSTAGGGAALSMLGQAGSVFQLFGAAGGMIVPSYAGGGFTVPGTRGGQLSVLHPEEMVLPANVTSHVLNSMNNASRGGDMHFTYAPTANAGTPFQSRSTAEQFFNRHGDRMMQFAQSLARNNVKF